MWFETQQQHEIIDWLVASGRQQNVSEALREGLSVLVWRDVEDEARLAALRAAANNGWADVKAGRFVGIDDAGLEDTIVDICARVVADCRSPW